MSTLAVAFGFAVCAAAGAVARGWFTGAMEDRRAAALATLVLNVTGAFALGALITNAGTGVLTAVGTAGFGALTTFSTMQLDLVELAELTDEQGDQGRQGGLPTKVLAAVYLLGTVVLGVIAADAGLRLEL